VANLGLKNKGATKMKRRRFGKEIKARVALEAIRGLKGINAIARDYQVHPNMVNHWKNQAISGIPEIFGNKRGPQKEIDKELIDELYKQIGKQQVELDWLKKKLNTIA